MCLFCATNVVAPDLLGVEFPSSKELLESDLRGDEALLPSVSDSSYIELCREEAKEWLDEAELDRRWAAVMAAAWCFPATEVVTCLTTRVEDPEPVFL